MKKNISKWKKTREIIEINGQEISVLKYRCLNGCGMTTTKEPDRAEQCPGCTVNNRRIDEARKTSTARMKAGAPKRKGGDFKEVETEGADPYMPPNTMKRGL